MVMIIVSSNLLFDCVYINVKILPENHIALRTVPTIVIAHTFCASPDTGISYRQCLVIKGYFCAI